ncbi:TRAP transporter small permease [Serratia odorifera]|uniref:TRAP transporter small permease protein n=2 Tax=Serratia odorifera TaxID=618 RepID=D4E9L8_SEROD|nr:TRAP transporter small permease [Serratia odorifera]EFE93435.1 TRAP transporter, DctQ-like membrane protein [Serratia odorifera DSM 4582]MBJ2065541.1 TRAP transporter small permease [Serratia odorifera]PNK88241.1 TRAP transporter small permease [Serratia odorifera]RII69321.1 TRAP transporter small permease [Serratia odorifera]VDZ65853.1 2,3-diketo-L-gulonate TRAP transporter small permease protein yiaM [Serratia odorifera]
MHAIRQGLDKLLEAICCLLLTMMVIVSCWQVISRYALGQPSTFSEELLRFSLVWLSMFGMAYAAGKQQHISLTFFLDKIPGSLHFLWVSLLQVCFALLAIYILIIGGLKISSISMQQLSPALNIPMGRVYYALPISGLLIIVYSVLNIYDLMHEKRRVTVSHNNSNGEAL